MGGHEHMARRTAQSRNLAQRFVSVDLTGSSTGEGCDNLTQHRTRRSSAWKHPPNEAYRAWQPFDPVAEAPL